VKTNAKSDVGESSTPDLPVVDDNGATHIPGLFVIGELAGVPLLKLGLNAGHRFVDEQRARLQAPTDANTLPLVVIGAGAAGLAAAMRAHELGIRCVVLEASAMANTVVQMSAGKVLYDEPRAVPKRSSLYFERCTKEQLLQRWHTQVEAAGLDIRLHTPVKSVVRSGEDFVVTTAGETLRARTVCVASGKSGAHRRVGAKGEAQHAHKIFHSLADAAAVTGQQVMVVGGGDSACEAALALCTHNHVTLLVRGDFRAAGAENRKLVDAAVAAKRITLASGVLTHVEATAVQWRDAQGQTHRIDNDQVYQMLGREVPKAWLKAMGLRMQNDWPWQRFAAAVVLFVAVYSLYALKKFPELPYAWPFTSWLEEATVRRVVGAMFGVGFAPFAWMFDEAALSDMRQTLWFQQGYLYSLMYTLVMIVFGAEALLRWTHIAKDPRLQRMRYASLIGFQIVFFLVANVVAVQGMSIQHAWRAWGLYQPWPLFFHTFNWWNDSDPIALKVLFIGGGLVGTLVIIPLLSRRHGKRFCSWVCGCGGLAETLGDRWRHLAPKGPQSRAWEFQSLVVLLMVAVVTAISVGAYQTRADNPWAQAYSYIVDFWLVAVLPIAAYPFFGGKIWCRYWCPLAAYNQLLSSWFGRLQIVSNDKCIRCGQCSKYCQVGVDVMSFAKEGKSFDNRNSSCIHCGICIDVCPVDVLSLSLKPTRGSLPVVQ
jgi:NosR/NirI family transcriptional regulator, nitrous oxide reductase regulator